MYSKMGMALNATGRDIWYMMCEWGHANPAEWAADLALANSWRTGNDLMPLFPSFMQVAEGNSHWWQYAKPGHYNDPDDVALGFVFGRNASHPWSALGDHVTQDEGKLYLGTWAMMKAPFILSVDFARNSNKPEGERNWPQWILPLVSNRDLIALSQDALSAQVRLTLHYQQSSSAIAVQQSSCATLMCCATMRLAHSWLSLYSLRWLSCRPTGCGAAVVSHSRHDTQTILVYCVPGSTR